jgi:ATP-binding cassette subfamily B protein
MTSPIELLFGRLRKLRERAGYVPRTVALIWSATRGWSAAWAGLLLGQGLLPVATLYLTRPLVDAIVAATSTHGDPARVRLVLILAVAMALVSLTGEILRWALTWVRTTQSELLQDYIRELIHRKSIEVDLAFYDSADFYDHLHRARNDGYYHSIALLECIGSFVQNTVTLVAMVGVLLSFGLWLPLALIISTLPALYVTARHHATQYDWRLRRTELERRADYYSGLLTEPEGAAEVRLFGLGTYFIEAYAVIRRTLRRESIELATDHSRAELGASALGLLVMAAALSAVLWRGSRGLISIGGMAFFYQAFQQGTRMSRSLLNDVGHLYVNTLFLRNLFDFLELKPRVVDGRVPGREPIRIVRGIQLSDVSFSYPGSPRPVLRQFNMTIPIGRIVAIVGPNGCGKSSLVKLLCRLYDPDSGHIDLDGHDIRDFSLEQLRRTMSVLCQRPVRYSETARENILLGNLTTETSDFDVERAAEAAGAARLIEGLPNGYYSELGRLFSSGHELSAGEWQRVALARALFRDAPVLVLDEPTSAMDPWAEAEWLDRLRFHRAGRTTIVITHKISTAMRADLIYVMGQGRVVESGSHEELVARGGPYSQVWSAQTVYEMA